MKRFSSESITFFLFFLFKKFTSEFKESTPFCLKHSMWGLLTIVFQGLHKLLNIHLSQKVRKFFAPGIKPVFALLVYPESELMDTERTINMYKDSHQIGSLITCIELIVQAGVICNRIGLTLIDWLQSLSIVVQLCSRPLLLTCKIVQWVF